METSIEIDRVPLSFIAAAAAGRSEVVARRVRDAIAQSLPDALAAACGHGLDDDEAYVFIERIAVDCSVGSHWSDTEIADRFAAQLARHLLTPSDWSHALVFRDRAEYVSAFLMSLPDGRAERSWWFEDFAGATVLPASACLRTVLHAEGETGWQALARLTPDAMIRVVSLLSPADADELIGTISDSGAVDVAVSELLASCEFADANPLSSTSHRLFAAVVQTVRTSGCLPSGSTVRAICAVAAILHAARAGQLPVAAPGSHAETVRAWCASLGLQSSDRESLLALDVTPLVERVESGRMGVPATGREPDGDLATLDYTPHGGAVILAIVLARSGRWQAWCDALRNADAGENPISLAAWLALTVVSTALSPAAPRRVSGDETLRRLFAGQAVTWPVVRGSKRRVIRLALEQTMADPSCAGELDLSALVRASADWLLAECGRRIPGCDGSSPRYLRTQCLALPAAVNAQATLARLGRPPLDVLLGFSGLKRATAILPDGRSIRLIEELVP